MTEQVQQILADAESDVKLLLQRRDGQAEAAGTRLVVHVLDGDPSAAHLVPQTSFIMNVGNGTQTFKWLSLAVRRVATLPRREVAPLLRALRRNPSRH